MNDDSVELIAGDDDKHACNYVANKRRSYFILLVYSAILGIRSCFLPEEDTLLDFILGLPLLILGIMWCYVVAAECGNRIG
ncbi:hypothetical protein [Bythopirellula goksoeyrii]|uniref:Uncharacterized protein n=1 Tax=Bythopirellula goksoeyrii TaxID=1400387 RepID=A0A5B9QBN4_9BACT|nr:hypothetical protein [Bythopirellula goksoeyrii]QEG36414.1 hypothetical protein Pr1d_37280 [Bythopirellula goksoeyrii]